MGSIIFSYKARDINGERIEGTVVAKDQDDALKKIQALRDQGLQDIRIENAVTTKKCLFCGQEVSVNSAKCESCQAILNESGTDGNGSENVLDQYLKRGFLIQEQDAEKAVLIKKKRFSIIFFIVWLIVGGLLGIIHLAGWLTPVGYLLYYRFIQRDRIVTIRF